MDITHIHSFLVKPEKSAAEQSVISGVGVKLDGEKLHKMLAGVFDNAATECIFDIVFSPDADGNQKNACKDLIVDYAQSPGVPNGRKIAERLQSFTDNRSGLGLLFLMVGADAAKRKVVLSRFPADSGVLADESADKLTVEFLERIFMKSSRFYKSAVYVGDPEGDEFWQGKAIDKQMTSGAPMADYWIKEFLLSDLATPGARGSMRLGEAMKAAFNTTDNSEIKDEIVAAIRLSGALDQRIFNTDEALKQMNLSEDTREVVTEHIPKKAREERFVLNAKELTDIAAFKSVALDNGVRLTADATNFDSLIVEEKASDGKSTFMTEGKVVDQRLRKSNQ